MVQVNEEMDEQGVPDDSVIRGLANIEIACENHPLLMMLMKNMWPTAETLLESPIDMITFRNK